MKKHFLIGTTIIAMVLSFGLLFYSIYAAVTPGFLVKNTISFAGSQNIKFNIAGAITGTNDPTNPDLTHVWEYDYEQSPEVENSWVVGNLVFDSEQKDIEDIHITYTFNITNECETEITAAFVGPEGIVAPLVATQYVQVGTGSLNQGSQIDIPAYGTAVLILKLTLSEIENIHINQNVDFQINMIPKTSN